ncbi:MAG: FtsH protease activity modulator HflK [Pseudomonadota bacterium]
MAWNESGGNNKNPWDRNGSGNQGPPDLDALIRKYGRRLSGALGGGGGGGNSGGDDIGRIGLLVMAVIAVVVWGFSGFYKVDEPERGVVLRFGKYHRTAAPGLQWRVPWPVDDVLRVNVTNIERFPYNTRMLTADENIVQLDLAVQYRLSDPKAVLFNVRDPVLTLQEVSESAIREIVGANQLDYILREGRAEVATLTKELIQVSLDNYGTGIEVTSVNLQDANFPTEVQTAVQDAIKAREDKDRLALEAEAYRNDVVPRARGAAARVVAEAEAYRQRVTADAQGDTARFLALLEEYQKAPEVTRERLYLETIENVYGNSSKVILDSDDSGNLLYLPLDRLLQRNTRPLADEGSSSLRLPSVASTPRSSSDSPSSRRTRDTRRQRGN